jgi:uncharacterized membrane protein YdbT with pleckstrin-like domain
MESPAAHDPGASPPPKVGPAPAGAAPPGPPSGSLIYQGGVSLWLGWRALLGALLAALVGLLVWTGGLYQEPGSWGRYLGVYAGLPLFVAATLMLLYVYFSLRSLHYRITTRLIERESGLFTKRVDSVDVARVKDVQLVQTMPERLLGIGGVEVFSSDQTDPVIRLEALPRARAIFEQLRDAVLEAGRRRGYMPMDR